jgi:predicted Rossmann fold nucleotide-binding protein DprA/Smf involved in DNA uptake
MASITKDITEFTYEELIAAAAEKKSAKVADVTKKLDESRALTISLEAELETLTGVPAVKSKRAYSRKNLAPLGRPSKGGKKGKRSGPTAKDAILSFLSKGPASSKEIIQGTKLNPGSINQALVVLKKDKTIKHDGKRGGKYSLK